MLGTSWWPLEGRRFCVTDTTVGRLYGGSVEPLAGRVPDQARARPDAARAQLVARQAGVDPEVVPVEVRLVGQPQRRDVPGHGRDHARQLAGSAQDAHARADGEPVARTEGARPGLTVGEPEEAARVDRADQVAEFVGVGEQQHLAAAPAGAPDQGAGPHPLGRQSGLAPESLDLVENRSLLARGSGQLAEPLDQLEH